MYLKLCCYFCSLLQAGLVKEFFPDISYLQIAAVSGLVKWRTEANISDFTCTVTQLLCRNVGDIEMSSLVGKEGRAIFSNFSLHFFLATTEAWGLLYLLLWLLCSCRYMNLQVFFFLTEPVGQVGPF